MSEHRIALSWEKGDAPFRYLTYPRNHEIAFKDGTVRMMFSAAPAFLGDASKADPEELLVAAISSCHMLSFLAVAAKRKLTVLSYRDDAVGFLENDSSMGSGGKLWITRVLLRPDVTFDSDPGAETRDELHHQAHEECFIANSVKTDIRVEPR